jgi:hypothetical protein
MVDEHNVSLELLVGNSLNQADPGNAGFESRLYSYKLNIKEGKGHILVSLLC